MNEVVMGKIAESLETLSRMIHHNNIKLGWRGPTAESRTFGDDIALIHSEVSEMLEAYRKPELHLNSMYQTPDGALTSVFQERDGRLNKPEGVAAEAADVLIRLLDVCQEFNIDLIKALDEKLQYNTTRSFRHGGKKL